MKIPFGFRVPDKNESEILLKLGFDLNIMMKEGELYYLEIPDDARIRYHIGNMNFFGILLENRNVPYLVRIMFKNINVIEIWDDIGLDDTFFRINKKAVEKALAIQELFPDDNIKNASDLLKAVSALPLDQREAFIIQHEKYMFWNYNSLSSKELEIYKQILLSLAKYDRERFASERVRCIRTGYELAVLAGVMHKVDRNSFIESNDRVINSAWDLPPIVKVLSPRDQISFINDYVDLFSLDSKNHNFSSSDNEEIFSRLVEAFSPENKIHFVKKFFDPEKLSISCIIKSLTLSQRYEFLSMHNKYVQRYGLSESLSFFPAEDRLYLIKKYQEFILWPREFAELVKLVQPDEQLLFVKEYEKYLTGRPGSILKILKSLSQDTVLQGEVLDLLKRQEDQLLIVGTISLNNLKWLIGILPVNERLHYAIKFECHLWDYRSLSYIAAELLEENRWEFISRHIDKISCKDYFISTYQMLDFFGKEQLSKALPEFSSQVCQALTDSEKQSLLKQENLINPKMPLKNPREKHWSSSVSRLWSSSEQLESNAHKEDEVLCNKSLNAV